MAIAFEVEEHFAERPEHVWAALTDWSRAGEWMAGIDTLEPEGPIRVGTALEFRARGKLRQSHITALEEGRRVALTSRQGPVTATYTYWCDPDGTGTRVRLSADCAMRGWMRVVAPLLRRAIASRDAGQLLALKRVLEGRGVGSS